MAKLLMITGLGSAVDLASSKKGAFYNTLEEFHKYWTRIDIICPRINNINSGNSKLETLNPKQSQNYKSQTINLFGNVFVHISPWPLILHPIFFIYKILKLHASTAIAVRVVNKKQTPEFLIKAGVPEKKVVYISSMYIDLDIFKPMGLPKEYDLIFVGRLVENKGINLLIKAVSKLRAKNEKLKVLIVGGGPLERELKSKIKSLKLENYVIFHGWAKSSQEIAELINISK